MDGSAPSPDVQSVTLDAATPMVFDMNIPVVDARAVVRTAVAPGLGTLSPQSQTSLSNVIDAVPPTPPPVDAAPMPADMDEDEF